MHLIQQWAETDSTGKDYLLKNVGHSLRNLDRAENGMDMVSFDAEEQR